MRYPHILAALRSTPWAATPETIQAIRDVLCARLTGGPGSRASGLYDDDDDEHSEPVAPRPPYVIAAPGVAYVEARGIVGKHLSGMETACGGLCLDHLAARLALAHADPGVASVVLHIDSPGGTVPGVPELAAKIRAWSAAKPIYAFTDTLCASAGYWLAAACSGIFTTPTATLGSIGVYMAAVDDSENWAKEGYKLVLIQAGKWKAAGHPGSQITPEQIALWQQTTDAIYAMFTADVRTGRAGIADETMQGQCFMGAAAVQVALADQLVTGLDEVLASLAVALPPLSS
jgi:signal peptide peptidase SppA